MVTSASEKAMTTCCNTLLVSNFFLYSFSISPFPFFSTFYFLPSFSLFFANADSQESKESTIQRHAHIWWWFLSFFFLMKINFINEERDKQSQEKEKKQGEEKTPNPRKTRKPKTKKEKIPSTKNTTPITQGEAPYNNIPVSIQIPSLHTLLFLLSQIDQHTAAGTSHQILFPLAEIALPLQEKRRVLKSGDTTQDIPKSLRIPNHTSQVKGHYNKMCTTNSSSILHKLQRLVRMNPFFLSMLIVKILSRRLSRRTEFCGGLACTICPSKEFKGEGRGGNLSKWST